MWEGDDIIPEKGKYYVFCAYAGQSGTTYIMHGVSGVTELEKDINESNFLDSEVYKEYLEAVDKKDEAVIWSDAHYQG